MLADNLHNVKETIASALARRTERKETGDEVCLVAVTKNHPAAVVTEREPGSGSPGKTATDWTSGKVAPDRSSADQ